MKPVPDFQLSVSDLDALAREYARSMFHYLCGRLAGDRDAADDLTQDVFLAALRSMPVTLRAQNDTDDPRHAWLFGIANNKLKMYFRGNRRARAALKAAQDRLRDSTSEGNANPPDLNEWISTTLYAVAPATRALLLRRYRDRRSMAELAGELGKTEKAVENLLHRARAEFRNAWQHLLSEDSS